MESIETDVTAPDVNFIVEVANLMADYELIEPDSIEKQIQEMTNWPYDKVKQVHETIMNEKVESRKLTESEKLIATEYREEADDLVELVEEAAQNEPPKGVFQRVDATPEPSNDAVSGEPAELEEWSWNDVIKDFGDNFVKLTCDKKLLSAVLTNESFERLEEMAALAHREFLRAKRKKLVLDKIVKKAHELLDKTI